MKKTFITVIVILLLTTACSRNELGELKELTPVETVIQTVPLVTTSDQLDAPGRITSRTDALVSAKVMGTVTQLMAKAGEMVKQGESLAVVDTSDIQSRIHQAEGARAQAQAALSVAESNYKRFKTLYEKNACSEVELEQAEMQYRTAKGALKSARGAVEEARAYLEYAHVKAPFDGIVVERMTNLGDFAAPGKPLFRLVDNASLTFECTVSEGDAVNIEKGTSATVQLDTADKFVQGTVEEISGGSDTYTHTVTVRIGLPQVDGVRAGMYGHAVFDGVPSEVVVIPEPWLVKRGALKAVFLVTDDQHAQLRIVRTGRTLADGIEIISGLNGNERIATTNLQKLSDGIPVEVR